MLIGGVVVPQSWPLTLDRAYYETEALLAAHANCPSHCPEVYHANRKMAVIIMRHIGEPATPGPESMLLQ